MRVAAAAQGARAACAIPPERADAPAPAGLPAAAAARASARAAHWQRPIARSVAGCPRQRPQNGWPLPPDRTSLRGSGCQTLAAAAAHPVGGPAAGLAAALRACAAGAAPQQAAAAGPDCLPPALPPAGAPPPDAPEPRGGHARPVARSGRKLGQPGWRGRCTALAGSRSRAGARRNAALK